MLAKKRDGEHQIEIAIVIANVRETIGNQF
jgi:hypothetical protein